MKYTIDTPQRRAHREALAAAAQAAAQAADRERARAQARVCIDTANRGLRLPTRPLRTIR